MLTKQNFIPLGFMALIIISALAAPRLIGIIIPVIGLLSTVYHFSNENRPPVTNKLWLIFAGFVLIGIASLFWTVDPDQSVNRLRKVLPVLLGCTLFLVAAKTYVNNLKNQDSNNTLKGLVFICGAGLLFILGELLFSAPIYQYFHQPAEDINMSAYNRPLLILFFVAAPLITILLDRKLNNHAAVLVLILGFTTFASESQSAQIGYILAGTTYALFALFKKNLTIFFGALSIFIFTALPFVVPDIFSNRPTFLQDIVQSGYPMHRLEIWDFVSRAVQQKPFIGHGIEAARSYQFDSQTLYHPANTVMHPHNMYLQIWFEFGLVGVLLASALFLFVFSKIVKADVGDQRIIMTTLVPYFAIAGVSYGLWQSWWVALTFLLVAYLNFLIRVRH